MLHLSVGVDSVEISRIARALERPSFRQKVFTAEEQTQLAGKKNPAASAAGYFAAKEAFAKAMGTGIRGFRLNEVGVVCSSLGAPCLVLTGRAAELCGKRNLALSITHTREIATAFVTVYEIAQ